MRWKIRIFFTNFLSSKRLAWDYSLTSSFLFAVQFIILCLERVHLSGNPRNYLLLSVSTEKFFHTSMISLRGMQGVSKVHTSKNFEDQVTWKFLEYKIIQKTIRKSSWKFAMPDST